MEDFIIPSNAYGGNTAIRKSEIAVIHEDYDEEVASTTLKDGVEYDTHETFNSIISKLTK